MLSFFVLKLTDQTNVDYFISFLVFLFFISITINSQWVRKMNIWWHVSGFSFCLWTHHSLIGICSIKQPLTYVLYIYIYNRLRTCCSCVMWGSIHVNRTVCPYLSYWLQFLSCSDLINYYFYKDQESLSSLEYLDLSGNNINKLITSRDK